MHEVRIQVEVPAAPADVWDVYTDYRRWPEWSDVKEVVLRNPGVPEPYGVGAVCVLRARGIAVEEEITGFDPPHRLTYRIVEGIPVRSYEGEVLLSPAGEHTRLVWRVQLAPRIPGTGAWIAGLVRRELEATLERLVAYPFAKPGQAGTA